MNRAASCALALGLLASTAAPGAAQDAEPETGGRTTLTAAEPHWVRGLLAGLDRDYIAARYHWHEAVAIHPGHKATSWQGRLTAFDASAARLMPDGELPASSNPYDARMWAVYVPARNETAVDDLGRAVRRDSGLLFDWRGAPVSPEEIDAALGHLAGLVAAEPENALALVQRGVVAAARGDAAAAALDWERAVEADPDFLLARLARGEARFRAGDFARAEADFDAAVRLDPESSFAHARRGWARHATGDHEGALADLARALALDPDEPEKLALRGLVLYELGRGEESLADFARAHRRDPRRLFERHPADGDEALAALAARYAARADEEPGNVAALFLLGGALRDAGRRDEAMAAYTRALVVRPDQAVAHLARAVLWQELDRPERALVEVERAIALDPRPARALVVRGNARLAAGDADGAAADYEAAIAAHPRFPWPYRNLGALLCERDPERSLELLTIAVHLDPDYAGAYAERARTWTVLGNLPAARNDRRMAELVSARGPATR